MNNNYINRFQRDWEQDTDGTWIAYAAPYKTRWSFKFSPIIGIGYWKDDYSGLLPKGSYAENFILPFFRIQFSCIYYPTPDSDKNNEPK